MLNYKLEKKNLITHFIYYCYFYLIDNACYLLLLLLLAMNNIQLLILMLSSGVHGSIKGVFFPSTVGTLVTTH